MKKILIILACFFSACNYDSHPDVTMCNSYKDSIIALNTQVSSITGKDNYSMAKSDSLNSRVQMYAQMMSVLMDQMKNTKRKEEVRAWLRDNVKTIR
jgi:hypothetical protein